jgi:hypothetical protein
MSDTLTDDIHDWASNFCGFDTRGGSSGSSDAPPPSSPRAAPTGTSDGGGPAANIGAPSGNNPDPNSTDYQQGFQDGVNGAASQAIPRDGDALASYNAGYEKGRAQWQSQQTPQSSSSTPATQPDPNATQSTDPNAPQPNRSAPITNQPTQSVDQTVRPPVSGAGGSKNPYAGTPLEAPWQQGFQDGSAQPDAQHDPPAPYADDARTAYSEGVLAGQTATRPPPEKTTTDKSDMPPPPLPPPDPASDNSDDSGAKDTLIDIAKSKGLVAAGEFIAGKVGGIIGYAIDLATSPGGDTSLPHLIYQACVASEGIPVPVPGANWHRKKENAEKDAADYEAKTGQKTMIDEQYSKDPDDPE